MTVLIEEGPDRVLKRTNYPLVVDLDNTFLKVDTLYELFARGLFTKPISTLTALLSIRDGIAVFKRRLASIVVLQADLLPVREELRTYLENEAATGREIHLATAADQAIATSVAERFPLFKSVQATDHGVNLKGANKARRLEQVFPTGFVYAGDSSADIPVWQRAKAAVVVSSSRALANTVKSAGIPLERLFDEGPTPWKAWLRAARPQQWAKNSIVLVPLALGWRDLTVEGLLTTLAIIALLCIVASLTYMVNDIADLPSDRKHWSKRSRPFASGTLPVRSGLMVVAGLLPTACIVALLISPSAGFVLLLYVVVTLGYSFGWKRIPIFDTFLIGLLFTIRVLVGIAAASLTPSAWILTFSMFFFFSLALAKRHTELLRAATLGVHQIEGRGYQTEDADLTLVFGISGAMASIVIVVIYLVEEVFSRAIYTTPAWLWGAPIAIFLFCCRIWVLSHRGKMTDDPVAFALRDRVSLGLGVFVVIAIMLAL